jgi:hypothetical protein
MRNRSAALILIVVLLAGCSGAGGPGGGFVPAGYRQTPGGPSGPGKPGGPGESGRHGHVSVRLTLTIPHKRRGERVDSKHPSTISPSTESVGIAVNGGAPVFFDATPGSPECGANAKGTTCAFSVHAPAGADTFVVTTYIGKGGQGTILDRGTAAVKIAAGKANAAAITLGPVVTNGTDGGTGSLRYAIATANPGDTILFLTGANATISLLGAITISRNVTIAGPGVTAKGAAYSGITISGSDVTQMFAVKAGASVTISGLILANGVAGVVSQPGGAILNDGTLALDGDAFTQNSSSTQTNLTVRADVPPAHIPHGSTSHRVQPQHLHPHCAGSTFYEGGAVYNHGTLAISDSIFDGNAVGSDTTSCIQGLGGAIYNDEYGVLTAAHTVFKNNAAYDGGAVYNNSEFGQATFTDDTFSSNTGCTPMNGCSTSPFGQGAAIFDAQGAGVTIATSAFEDNVAGGNYPASQGNGGALYLETGSPSVTNSTFTGNVAGGGSSSCSEGQGGAIYLSANGPTTMELDGDTFTGNRAGGDEEGFGGAVASYKPIQVNDDKFDTNSAIGAGSACQSNGNSEGGAVFTNGGATIAGSSFSGNTSSASDEAAGGAIYAQDTMRLTTDTLTSNASIATGSTGTNTMAFGGALYSQAEAYLSGNAFTSNKVTAGGTNNGEAEGGAIYANSTINSTGNMLVSNSAGASGGNPQAEGGALFVSGLYVSSGDAFKSNAVTSSNGASGGAIYNTGQLNLEGATLTSNSATGQFCYGGALYNNNSSTVVSGGTFTGNTASSTFEGWGGAIYDNTGMTLSGSTLVKNSASQAGGAMYLTGLETITGATISGNKVLGAEHGLGGGGVYSTDETTLTNTTITGNSVTLAGTSAGGGGVYATNAFTMNGSTVSDNSVTGNFTQSGGGGIFGNGITTLQNSTVTANVSSVDGGGVLIDGGSAKATLTNVTMYQNRAVGTGGNLDNLGTTTMSNSIAAGGSASSGSDATTTSMLTSGDYNIIQTAIDGTLAGVGPHDQLLTNPKLLPLANNGGPTWTNADQPVGTSPGTGAIPFSGNVCGTNGGALSNVDQRGYARGSNATCDIGAYEYAGVASAIVHRQQGLRAPAP